MSFIVVKEIGSLTAPQVINTAPFEVLLVDHDPKPLSIEIITKFGKSFKLEHNLCVKGNGQISLYQLSVIHISKFFVYCFIFFSFLPKVVRNNENNESS